MTRPKTHSDRAPAVLPTVRGPGHRAHPLGRHLPTERPNRQSAAAPGDGTRRDLPQPASQADGRAAGYPAVVTVRHGNLVHPLIRYCLLYTSDAADEED